MNSNLKEHYPYPPISQQVDSDEIDLRELFAALWQGKWLIIAMTFVFAVAGVGYSLYLPNIYKSEALLAPANDQGGGGLASMAGQLGGLASLAGVNLGSGGGSETEIALATLQSRQFISEFIHTHKLAVPLAATEGWDDETNQWIINLERYNPETQTWLKPDDAPADQPAMPTDWQLYKMFSEQLSVNEKKDNGLITLSFESQSPVFAQQVVELLVNDINTHAKQEKLAETKTNIGYLRQQLDNTNLTQMQNVFYQLIEEQTKNLMLAEVQDEFVFKTVDPAIVPEEKAGPKRALICVLATLLGGMLGVAIVLVRFAFRKDED
ncbi:Wzz/FepE/Etk N-terminal domain-containing protein [Salinivibrio proteolyticus]|uniref:Wzz/FepE/Etk N-terminal domain-containing protein n=1 Tax=Salinivibrio proteolyticus TaxID=334715 RepID=UPI000988E9F9|nr:Wzz/FepE/Etk N-terminal domain-containing protein [Salinivibrio proteolyticus]OOF31723.1 LPS O-antigen length regulator [Salinivibrio proteolyticus]